MNVPRIRCAAPSTRGKVGLVHVRAEVGYRIKGSSFLTNGQLFLKLMLIKPRPTTDIGDTGIEFLADLNMGFVTCIEGLVYPFSGGTTGLWCLPDRIVNRMLSLPDWISRGARISQSVGNSSG